MLSVASAHNMGQVSDAQINKFVSGLKSRSEETRIKTAYELQRYVTTDLKEVKDSTEMLQKFLDNFKNHIKDMVSSNDVHENKGGIYAIMSLVDVDVGQAGQLKSRFTNYLQILFNSSDTTVLELAAKAVGHLYLASGPYASDIIEGMVKRSFEWLQEDRSEYQSRRHAAVLVLRELALSVPTYFFQQVSQFLDLIFEAVWDSRPAVREVAVGAIRVALSITSQRETKEAQQPQWYKHCLKEIRFVFVDSVPGKEKLLVRDDRIHGSLLVLNELIRCSNNEWERLCKEFRHITHYHICSPQKKERRSSVVKRLRNQMFAVGPTSPHLRDILTKLPMQDEQTELRFSEHTHESRHCRELLLEEYDMICNLVLSQRNSRNPYIQSALLQTLPRLAALDIERFARNYLLTSLNHLLTTIKTKEKDRPGCFVCLGMICLAVGSSSNSHIPAILNICKTCLPSKDTPSKKRILDPSVCICLSLVAKAVGPVVYKDVQVLLEPMLASGLSIPLTVALQSLAVDIPKLKRDIAEGLLRILHQILIPKGSLSVNQKTGVSAPSQASPVHQGDASVVLALRTLGSFDFEGTGQSLLPFIRVISDTYLSSNQKEVRMEAIPTLLHLLRPICSSSGSKRAGSSQKPRPPHSVFVIVSKVLWVCVSDPDADVRLCVLTSFDEAFDRYMAQAENYLSLVYAMSDESFEIREHAVCTLGRLASINPSYIHPRLRKALMKFLDELDYSGIGRNRELSAKLLGHLISSAPRFMRQFGEAIMSVLVPKLQKDKDPNPAVIMGILTAIGDLAQVSGTDMKKWLKDLLPFLIDMLGDGSSMWKRQVGLVTLGQLVENTGCVVHPYTQYPALLDILLSFLKTEQQPNVRKETLRVLGLLGALDPYKHKVNIGMIKIQQDTGVALICITENKNDGTSEMTTSEMLVNYSALEEFYPACAIAVLMKVIRDPTLIQHRNEVVRSVTFIFKSLGVKGVPYLSRVIPSLLFVINTSDVAFCDYLFTQLSTIIDIVKQHIRTYLDDIVAVLKKFWHVDGRLENTSTVISVAESIATAVGTEFKMYLKDLIPMILKTFQNDSREKTITKKLLLALQKFDMTIDEYLHMILPPIIALFNDPEAPLDVRRTAIQTVDHFVEYLDLGDYVSQIVHPLLRTIESTPDLRSVAVELLCSMATQLGRPYGNFVPVVQRVLNKHKVVNDRYDILVAKVIKGLPVTDDEMLIVNGPKLRRESPSAPSMTIKKGTVSVNALQKAWSFSRLVSKEDWLAWLRRLSIELMKSSPSPALRACYSVATTYPQLSRDLFNAAFVSCWSELSESLQDDFLQSLKQALTSQDIPEITQTLLNLAEFMEHCEKGHLPLDIQLLAEKAIECRAYAKALHYKEEEFHKNCTPEVLQSLISINTKLGQTEAAGGLLEFSRKPDGSDMQIQEKWFEKLNDWEKALQAYRDRLNSSPDDINLELGQMRCLEALGEWGELYDVSCKRWNSIESLTEDCRRQMSSVSAAAAWAMGQWDAMENYTNFIPRETQEGAFYRAVLAIHKNEFQNAQELIELSRELLDTELTAMVGESYQRAYNSMVAAQKLAELEEVIQFILTPERRKAIAQMWWDRLQGCQKIVEDWQKILQVRSLVLNPQDDMRAWLKFASMCRKGGRLTLTHKTLVTLIGFDPSQNSDTPLPAATLPHVTYQYCKYLYAFPEKKLQAFKELQNFLKQLPPVSDAPSQKLVSRIYLKLGLWHQELHGLNDKNLSNILYYLKQSKDTDFNCYKAWHAFACMNFEALMLYRSKEDTTSVLVESDEAEDVAKVESSAEGSVAALEDDQANGTNKKKSLVTEFAIAACKGFVQSITLSDSNNTLQDTLRLLTVCFEHGSEPDVHQVLVNKLKTIRIDNWLQVIPQLIARIDTHQPLVNKLIHQLLVNVGKQHPQALLYPLTVAAKSSESSRVRAAEFILKSMREHSNELVDQAMMISEELIRVAILWHEKWYEGLEEASRLFFGEHNIPAMFRTLRPLHTLLERGPITLKEMSFNQAYGRDLMEAAQWCREYQKSHNLRDLNQAWELYYQVFKRLSRQLTLLSSLDLESVSPRLHACKDLDIAVPGSYSPNSATNKISSIHPNIQVLTSKQKPRKLCIRGSDGHDYIFILKGHEDLRQDERVMQLFGLVNTLLVSNPETFRRNLTIQRYAVIPLSTNSGLIGWVPNCDTLHVLIRDWRDKKKILLTIEHRIMNRMAPDLEHLTLMQKVEVFEHALELTQGDDLAKLLWIKSPSSEVWFDRRTNYTRSLAAMSMVGYVLGLGDRHPSNLMLHQLSGKIVHIDFGDCFEVAMAREKFPEKIPFRLTRMLINAMEVTGIEGTYFKTCESVMALLRKNKDSLMAMLEAFIYDPLLNWRLMDKDRKGGKKSIDDEEEDIGETAESSICDNYSGTVRNSSADDGADSVKTADGSAHGDSSSRASAKDKRSSEAGNKKALTIVHRVRDKLTGRDFNQDESLDVRRQVELLIEQATSHENLCQCYVGWCPFW